jgi:hypothetical protein
MEMSLFHEGRAVPTWGLEERTLALDRVGCMNTGMYGAKEFVMDFVFTC